MKSVGAQVDGVEASHSRRHAQSGWGIRQGRWIVDGQIVDQAHAQLVTGTHLNQRPSLHPP